MLVSSMRKFKFLVADGLILSSGFKNKVTEVKIVYGRKNGDSFFMEVEANN